MEACSILDGHSQVTKHLLEQITSLNLEVVTFLDLSGLHLVGINHVQCCPSLEILILRNNDIDYIPDLLGCPNLWKIDLSYNRLKFLNGLTSFHALGVLSLSHNRLEWKELEKIKHLQVLSIHLDGNPHLVSDPNYRLHVIDSLPMIWSLDEVWITSSDRVKVSAIFRMSAKSKLPIRQKLSANNSLGARFKCKHNMIVGKWTEKLMHEFSMYEVHNKILDLRRVDFAAKSLQYLFDEQNFDRHAANTCFTKIVSCTKTDFIIGLTVIIISCSIFSLSVDISMALFELLETSELSWHDVLSLPKHHQAEFVGILYAKLLLHGSQMAKKYIIELSNSIRILLKFWFMVSKEESAKRDCSSKELRHAYQIMAVYLIHYLCELPDLYVHLTNDLLLLDQIVKHATGDEATQDELKCYIEVAKSKNESKANIDAGIKRLLNNFRMHSVGNFREPFATMDERLKVQVEKSTGICHLRSASTTSSIRLPTCFSHLLSEDSTKLNRNIHSTTKVRGICKQPNIGDVIYLGPQCFGKLLATPTSTTGLIQIQSWSATRYNQKPLPNLQEKANDIIKVKLNSVKWLRGQFILRSSRPVSTNEMVGTITHPKSKELNTYDHYMSHFDIKRNASMTLKYGEELSNQLEGDVHQNVCKVNAEMTLDNNLSDTLIEKISAFGIDSYTKYGEVNSDITDQKSVGICTEAQMVKYFDEDPMLSTTNKYSHRVNLSKDMKLPHYMISRESVRPSIHMGNAWMGNGIDLYQRQRLKDKSNLKKKVC